jgi:hypothetical protein
LPLDVLEKEVGKATGQEMAKGARPGDEAMEGVAGHPTVDEVAGEIFRVVGADAAMAEPLHNSIAVMGAKQTKYGTPVWRVRISLMIGSPPVADGHDEVLRSQHAG